MFSGRSKHFAGRGGEVSSKLSVSSDCPLPVEPLGARVFRAPTGSDHLTAPQRGWDSSEAGLRVDFPGGLPCLRANATGSPKGSRRRATLRGARHPERSPPGNLNESGSSAQPPSHRTTLPSAACEHSPNAHRIGSHHRPRALAKSCRDGAKGRPLGMSSLPEPRAAARKSSMPRAQARINLVARTPFSWMFDKTIYSPPEPVTSISARASVEPLPPVK